MKLFCHIVCCSLFLFLTACGGGSSGGKATTITSTSTPTASSPATAPAAISLNVGTSNAVSGVTNVAIPAAGGTDRTGAVSGWIASTNNTIKFSVTDAATASSSITIDGTQYISGSDFVITSARTLTIVVSTSETGSTTVTRTFSVAVTASGNATSPSAFVLAAAVLNPVGGVTNVAIPEAGGTDSTGTISDWIATTNANIKFTVTDISPATSTIKINGANYVSGSSYAITVASPLTIVVTTAQVGAITVIRTFTVGVLAANYATAPTAITLAVGSSNAVASVRNVSIPTPGNTDANGAVTGWVATSNSRIKFTVTDTSPAVSVITINGVSYTNGADYSISVASPLTVAISTSQAGKITATRNFTISVASALKTDPTITAISDVVIDSTAFSHLCMGTSLQECIDTIGTDSSSIYFLSPISNSPGAFTSFTSSNSDVIASNSGTAPIFSPFNPTFTPFNGSPSPQLTTIITLNQSGTAYYNPGSISFVLTMNPQSIVYSPTDGSPIGSCLNSGTAFKRQDGTYGCVCGSPYNNPLGLRCGQSAVSPSPLTVENPF
jgi:hypothetical protein